MDLKVSDIELEKVPFKLNSIPTKYPAPEKLRLL